MLLGFHTNPVVVFLFECDLVASGVSCKLEPKLLLSGIGLGVPCTGPDCFLPFVVICSIVGLLMRLHSTVLCSKEWQQLHWVMNLLNESVCSCSRFSLVSTHEVLMVLDNVLMLFVRMHTL